VLLLQFSSLSCLQHPSIRAFLSVFICREISAPLFSITRSTRCRFGAAAVFFSLIFLSVFPFSFARLQRMYIAYESSMKMMMNGRWIVFPNSMYSEILASSDNPASSHWIYNTAGKSYYRRLAEPYFHIYLWSLSSDDMQRLIQKKTFSSIVNRRHRHACLGDLTLFNVLATLRVIALCQPLFISHSCFLTFLLLYCVLCELMNK